MTTLPIIDGRLTGHHTIHETVDLRGQHIDASQARIKCVGRGVIIAGGNASSPVNPTQRFYEVMGTGNGSAIQIMGAKGQRIEVERCNHIQLLATTSQEYHKNYSIAYSKFDFGFVNRLELISQGEKNAWINENVFFLRRCERFFIFGEPHHRCDHNRIVGGTFEGVSLIDLERGTDNRFEGIRFEGNKGRVYFGPVTQRNVIINTWDSSESDHLSPNVTVEDHGTDNAVIDSELISKTRIQLASAYSEDALTGDGWPILETPMFSVICGDEMLCSTDGKKGYRAELWFFSRSFTPMLPKPSWVSSPQIKWVMYGRYLGQGTGTSSSQAAITRQAITDGVRYVRCRIKGSYNQPENQTARVANVYLVTSQVAPYILDQEGE